MAIPPEAHSHTEAQDAARRALARLRFDLHDGPQQDLYLLAQDLELFRTQLEPLLDGHPDRERALGRLDDLAAQVAALDAELRRLSAATREPRAPGIREVLAELASAFADRTRVTPAVECSGELEALTDSQQLAVLAVVREALSNIRKHGQAECVAISVTAGADGVTLRVRDDGVGFDAQATATGAAREGHLGLVGMRERVEMLGGRFEIDSRPGGPTIVAVTLPRWPDESGQQVDGNAEHVACGQTIDPGAAGRGGSQV